VVGRPGQVGQAGHYYLCSFSDLLAQVRSVYHLRMFPNLLSRYGTNKYKLGHSKINRGVHSTKMSHYSVQELSLSRLFTKIPKISRILLYPVM
jgi:hypothetical protein